MPIYEYECRGCGELFEQLILKETVAECPTCKSQDLEQLLSGFAVSSDSITRANVSAARKKYASSRGVIEKKIYEAEEVIEHTPSLVEKKIKPENFIGHKKTT